MRFHLITLGLMLLISAAAAQNNTHLQPYRINRNGNVRAAGVPSVGSIFSAIKTIVDIYKVLKDFFKAPEPGIYVTLVNDHCGVVRIQLIQAAQKQSADDDRLLLEQDIPKLTGEMQTVTFKFVPEAPVYVVVLDRRNTNDVPREMYRFFVTTRDWPDPKEPAKNPTLDNTPTYQVFSLKSDIVVSHCADRWQFKSLAEKCRKRCYTPRQGQVPICKQDCDAGELMCTEPKYKKRVGESLFNSCIGLPNPKSGSLADFGVKDGSIIALRNNYGPALNKGRGYLSLCNECSDFAKQIATHSGDSKKNTWSQFKVEFLKKEDRGYQLINLKNVWGNNYLSVCRDCAPGIHIGTFTDDPKVGATQWWAAVVEDEKTKKKHLSLMTEYGQMRYQTGKLCETCFPGGRDEFTVSKDSGPLESYQLYTVEKIK